MWVRLSHLSDDAVDPASLLQPSQGHVCGVGLDPAEIVPARKAPCPVPGPGLRRRHELRETGCRGFMQVGGIHAMRSLAN